MYLRDHQVGDAGSEIRCIFGPIVARRAYVPDYIFVVGPNFRATNDSYYGAPALAVEILSPRERRARLQRKLDFYLEHGAQLVWVIDLTHRTVRVLTPEAEVLHH